MTALIDDSECLHPLFFPYFCSEEKAMIKSTGITFQYTDSVRFQFPDIECHFGEHLLLLGESGKGKTTLLHLLAWNAKTKLRSDYGGRRSNQRPEREKRWIDFVEKM